MSDACSRHLGRVQEYINRLEERNEGLRSALVGVAAALGYGDGEAPRPEELADRVSELRDVVERQAATLRRKCGTTHRYPTEGELSPEMRARLMPEGMNWPRFEDGEPVRMGDEVASRDDDGSPMTMRAGIVRISGGSVRLYDNNGFRITGEGGDGPLRRPAPSEPTEPQGCPRHCRDSWERLEEDVCETEQDGACGYSERLRGYVRMQRVPMQGRADNRGLQRAWRAFPCPARAVVLPELRREGGEVMSDEPGGGPCAAHVGE